MLAAIGSAGDTIEGRGIQAKKLRLHRCGLGPIRKRGGLASFTPPQGGTASSPPTIRPFHSNPLYHPPRGYFVPFLKYPGGWRNNKGGGNAYAPRRLARSCLWGLVSGSGGRQLSGAVLGTTGIAHSRSWQARAGCCSALFRGDIGGSGSGTGPTVSSGSCIEASRDGLRSAWGCPGATILA